jgi:hypothetical protein
VTQGPTTERGDKVPAAPWPRAAARLEQAVARRDGTAHGFHTLGELYEVVDRMEDARRAYASALEREPNATEHDWVLLGRTAQRFRGRRRMARFVQRHLDEILDRAAAAMPPAAAVTEPSVTLADTAIPPRVWVYWEQGFAHAPPVARLCRAELDRFHAPGEVVGLDADSEPAWTDIPSHVREKTAADRTRFSDVVRLDLLSRYGGVWVDATCLPRTRLPAHAATLAPTGFFAFTSREARPSSWFLASAPGHPLLVLLREAEYAFWAHRDTPLHYFDLHHMFEALHDHVPWARTVWGAVPEVGHRAPLRLRSRLHSPYDPERFRDLVDGMFVHKLGWRYDPARSREDTMLGHLLRDGPG